MKLHRVIRRSVCTLCLTLCSEHHT